MDEGRELLFQRSDGEHAAVLGLSGAVEFGQLCEGNPDNRRRRISTGRNTMEPAGLCFRLFYVSPDRSSGPVGGAAGRDNAAHAVPGNHLPPADEPQERPHRLLLRACRTGPEPGQSSLFSE
ncbi:uncharacterized protein ACNS7B_019696 [Menidia menidia]